MVKHLHSMGNNQMVFGKSHTIVSIRTYNNKLKQAAKIQRRLI